MKRGDVKKGIITMVDGGQPLGEAGLVCWRDRNIVYCISNNTNNHETDVATRRGDGGIIRIPRPTLIANYNKYMGGVDVTDMRRLHCNSSLMGQNRWWLKLFFYLLDVGTSNALVLYNEALRAQNPTDQFTPLNIVSFKMRLIEDLGRGIDEISGNAGDRNEDLLHRPIRVAGEARYRCVYCSMNGKRSAVRYVCSICGLPLCVPGHGKSERNCFAICHEVETRRQDCMVKWNQMKRMTR